MLKKALLLFFFFTGAALVNIGFSEAAFARDFYASPTGAGTGLVVTDPTNFPNALALALDGDLVHLAAGTYAPPATLVVNKKISIDGPSATVDCQYTTTCMKYMAFTGDGYFLSGLTFENYYVGVEVQAGDSPIFTALEFNTPNVNIDWTAKAVYCFGSKASPFIENSDFYGDTFSDGSYYDQVVGVYAEKGSPIMDHLRFERETYGVYAKDVLAEPTVNHSVFFENYWGVVSEGASFAFIKNSTFSHSTAFPSSGGVSIQGANTVISNNSFDTLVFGVDVIDLLGSNAVTIRKNTFNKNTYGVELADSYYWLHSNSNMVEQNDFTDCSYGVFVFADQMVSKIAANHFKGNEYGIYLSSGATTKITNNVIEESVTAGILSHFSQSIIAYNTIVNGTKDGIFISGGDTAYIANNIVYGNGNAGIVTDMTSSGVQMGCNDVYSNYVIDISGPYVDLGGNMTVDPIFVSSSDFHLNAASPLINQAWLIYVSKDFDGKLRTVRSGASGPEIGAYEL